MHDVPRPEAPVITLLSHDDYAAATRRIRELSDADRRSCAYLERLALLAAVKRWNGEQPAPPAPVGRYGA